MFLVKLLPKVELKFKAQGQSYLPGESPRMKHFGKSKRLPYIDFSMLSTLLNNTFSKDTFLCGISNQYSSLPFIHPVTALLLSHRDT